MTTTTTELTARERAIDAFTTTYGRSPSRLARAPGRVNLIGEHTDYNDGFVLPMALEHATWLAFDRRADDTVRLLASDLGSSGEFDLSAVATAEPAAALSAEERSWLDYPRGVAWSLALDGYGLQGFDGAIASDVPRGAGLSSSAALELAVAAAFLLGEDENSDAWDVRRVARAMQRTENDWIGVNSGIMDQLISAAARQGHALLIDCRDLSTTPVPLPTGMTVAILDTGTRRGLVGSAYNERRASCERVAEALGVLALRDVELLTLNRFPELDPVDRRRARHVIEENVRTVQAANALNSGDVHTAGALMRQSHASLRDLYEVSSPELDAMVAAAEAAPGCLGARMTGAGFGGFVVALVECNEHAAFEAECSRVYFDLTGREATTFGCRPSAGAGATKL